MTKNDDVSTRRDKPEGVSGVATASANEKAPHYWYETQERAFAPRIADGWPAVIAAPHTKNGRLVRRNGDPTELLAALREILEGFDRGIFVRSISDDANPAWAIKLFPYLKALADGQTAIAKAEGR